jgi:arylsulfatase A-like enzyme
MRQPNIIVILIDDMGVRDLGCTGSTFYETPHIDRLAGSGVNLTQGYAASSLCSPARAALLTGRCPARVGITNYIPGNGIGRLRGPAYHHALPASERTIASALREGGYHTWHVGKWHPGGTGSLPTDRGFEVNIGGNHHGGLYHIPGVYFAPWTGRDGSKLPGLEQSVPGEYLTDRLTTEAISLIQGNRDGRPFFLHLSHYAVHAPIVSPPDLVARYEAKGRRLGLDRAQALVEGELHPALHLLGQRIQRRVLQSHPGYAAMVHNLDWNVGRLLAALDESGQADNTLVVFLSDNGGLSVGVEGSPTCTLPYREGKGWSEEGGLRIPLLVRWPARVAAGRALDLPVWQCDLYPTLLDAAGLPPEPDRHRDGVSILPTLVAGTPPPRDALCWHYPHYSNQGGGPTGAIRCGDWKLIEHYETGVRQLFHLASDVAEAFDRAADCPDRVADLARRLADWRRDTGAVMPQPNPLYDDTVAGRHPRPDGSGHYPPATSSA